MNKKTARGASCDPASAAGFYCDMSAFTAQERRHHLALLRDLFGSIHGLRELPDGYDFLLPDGSTAEMAGRFIVQERRCCPFLSLSLHSEPPHDALLIRMTGPKGIKAFLGAEVGHLLPAQLQASLSRPEPVTGSGTPHDDALRFVMARVEDLPQVQKLLNICGLPAGDIRNVLPHLLLARVGERLSGCIGLEVHGELGLLRSLAVAPSARGRGLGHTLYARMLDHARVRRMRALYLLTTDASDFFAQRGFRVVSRTAVPEPIRATTQFQRLCPSSAVCMERPLTE